MITITSFLIGLLVGFALGRLASLRSWENQDSKNEKTKHEEQFFLPWKPEREPKGKNDFDTINIVNAKGKSIFSLLQWEELSDTRPILDFIITKVNGQ